MTETSRAEQVLASVLDQLETWAGTEFRAEVLRSWTEGVVDEIVTCEIGEPLGSLHETLRPDAEGVMWWTGNLPEWKVRR